MAAYSLRSWPKFIRVAPKFLRQAKKLGTDRIRVMSLGDPSAEADKLDEVFVRRHGRHAVTLRDELLISGLSSLRRRRTRKQK